MTILHELYRVLWQATWANNVAALESAVIVAALAAVRRDWIGRHLAAWWSRHRREHEIEHHLEALRRHEAEKRGGHDG